MDEATVTSLRQVHDQLAQNLSYIAQYSPNAAHQRLASRYLGAADVIFKFADIAEDMGASPSFNDAFLHAAEAQKHMAVGDLTAALIASHLTLAAALSAMPGIPGWTPPILPPVPK
jgi:hypothetical protein